MKGSTSDGIDKLALRRSLGSFLTGVTVVTTIDEAGRPRGMTANSFTSVSLDPPLVLVGIDRAAASYPAFRECQGYVVHILGAHQRELAAKFASKDPDKFAGLDLRPSTSGAPILSAVPGWIDCRTEQAMDAGDHILLIGRVTEFQSVEDRPLGYHQGRFVTFDPELDIQKLQTADAVWVGWMAEADDGRVALARYSDGRYGIPLRQTSTRSLTDEALATQAAETIGAGVTIQFLYSIYPRDGLGDLALVYRAVIDEHLPTPSWSDGIEFHRADEIPWDAIRSRSERVLLRRYLKEREGDTFGIYAGTEASGSYAMVASTYSTPATQEHGAVSTTSDGRQHEERR